jgi:hypothetical protein
MAKLFIKPAHGHLGEVIDALRKKSIEPHVIGWGYPPIYVESDTQQEKDIKELVLGIDGEVEFSAYRDDFIDIRKLPEQLRKYCSLADLQDICFSLGVDHQSLPGGGNNLNSLSRELIQECQRMKQVSELIRVVHEKRPHAIEEIVAEPPK